MNDDQKDFKDYVETLPPEIKQAIYSIDYPQKLQEIVKNNKLMIDQAGKLEAETTLVMAGLEPMDSYVRNLQTNVGLSSIQASVVAHDVNETIFKGIRDALKKINDEIAEEEKIISEKVETPTKEEIVSGIEKPSTINEPMISITSLPSNSNIKPEIHPEMAKEGIEIRVNKLPEVAPKVNPPTITSSPLKAQEPIHINISPVTNIVEAKLTTPVAVPKENILVTDNTKLPEKSQPVVSQTKTDKPAGDPYRELPM